MTDINIDTAAVIQAASELKNCASQLREKKNALNNIEEEIETAWKSKYTRQYLDCLEETENDVEKTIRYIETIAAELMRIAQAAETTEAELQRIVSGSGRHLG